MGKEIIEAEYREVKENLEILQEITAEIKYITEQLNRTLLSGIIEIGKRFDRAKSLVKHGEWGKWCEQYTGYKQSMAENYIKVYKEYGAEQYSLFGDLSKSQSIGNLGVTKLLELTALPPDEREQFVEENRVSEDTTVKELQELIKQQKEKLQTAEKSIRDKELELRSSIERNDQSIQEKQTEIERLTKELEQREQEKQELPEDEMSRMMAEADEKARQELHDEISRAVKEKEAAEAEAEKLKSKYEKLKEKNGKAQQEVDELKQAVSGVREEKEELQSQLEKMKKESLLGANEKIVQLNICFEDAQDRINKLKKSLKAVEDTQQYDKLRPAIIEQMKKLIASL
jgi:uncharacterized phage infection (PIP) family protein YhgE|nr:MAG TPA: Protein of unknown function (DUF3102) [Caudoviricetes sp.]